MSIAKLNRRGQDARAPRGAQRGWKSHPPWAGGSRSRATVAGRMPALIC